jgi:uracil-DNA glycosylase
MSGKPESEGKSNKPNTPKLSKEQQLMENLFNSIPSEWKNIFLQNEESTNLLGDVFKSIMPDIDNICPQVDDVFNAFNLTRPENVKVVIVGQDPYHTLGVADGLCFSTQPGNDIPPSLKNIYGALTNGGSIEEKPYHACLNNWAAQGVLMINSALTTKLGTAGAHTKIWAKWTQWLIQYLSDNYDELTFLLWGGKAQNICENVDTSKHIVWVYIHPSPMANTVPEHLRFDKCPHFELVSEWYLDKFNRTFNWNPTQSTTVFTDGACKGNGQKGAKAGYGVYFQTGPLAGLEVFSPLPTGEYEGEVMKQTNIRAEMLAAIDALEIYMERKCIGPLYLVIDCEFVMKVMDCWLDMWSRKNKIDQMKNPDLLWRLKSVMSRVKVWQKRFDLKFKVIHVYSHIEKKKKTVPQKGTKEYTYWQGNERADKLSNDGVVAKERTVSYSE